MDTAPPVPVVPGLMLGQMELYWFAVILVAVVSVMYGLRQYHGRPWLRFVAMAAGAVTCALVTPAGWMFAPTMGVKIGVGAALGGIAPNAWNVIKRKLEAKVGHKLAETIHIDPTASMRATIADAVAKRDAKQPPTEKP